jgi:polysaccharide export outer membrane protein
MSDAAPGATPAEDRHMSELGPGDSVSIQIFGQPDITNIYVGDDGTINVPLAGPVQVGGSSPVEAAQRVAKALKSGGYFVDPHVTVLVTQSRSQLVSVLGEVQTAGRYVITPRTTVVDLLAQAGGVKDTAAEVGYLLRPSASGRVDRIAVSLNGVSTAQGAVPNQTLMGGDSLVVPRAEHFFVYGEVATPGMYRLEPNMSVMQAIARAGGVTARGSERRIQVKRQGKDGQIKVFKPKPVDPVQAEDIIQVKESIF